MARNDKHLAVRLRRLGKGYNFISKELGVPKSTLSDWFSGMTWSKVVKTKLTERANLMARKRMKILAAAQKKRWQKWREQHRLEAIKEFPELKNKPLFIAGLMLYWAEGDNGKAGSNVRLTNIDPRMIKVFINFALSLCKVPKENIRIGLLIYPDLNENICKNFWSKYTSVPVNQFHKIQVIKGRHPTKRLEYGICIVRVGGGGLKEKIRTWIDRYSRELMRV